MTWVASITLGYRTNAGIQNALCSKLLPELAVLVLGCLPLTNMRPVESKLSLKLLFLYNLLFLKLGHISIEILILKGTWDLLLRRGG